jgi:spore maturation protein CgeB
VGEQPRDELPRPRDRLRVLLPGFYARQRFTLNVRRAPSVRLLEAAACGLPVISDACEGLAASFEPGRDILVAQPAGDVLHHLALPGAERDAIGQRARERVLRKHTAAHRARELERLPAVDFDVSEARFLAKPSP